MVSVSEQFSLQSQSYKIFFPGTSSAYYWHVLSFRCFNRSFFLSLLLWVCALWIVVVAVSTSITWCPPQTARPCRRRRRKTWRVHHQARSMLSSDLQQDLTAPDPWMSRHHTCQWTGVRRECLPATGPWPAWRILGHWCGGSKMYGLCIILQRLVCELGLLSVCAGTMRDVTVWVNAHSLSDQCAGSTVLLLGVPAVG